MIPSGETLDSSVSFLAISWTDQEAHKVPANRIFRKATVIVSYHSGVIE